MSAGSFNLATRLRAKLTYVRQMTARLEHEYVRLGTYFHSLPVDFRQDEGMFETELFSHLEEAFLVQRPDDPEVNDLARFVPATIPSQVIISLSYLRSVPDDVDQRWRGGEDIELLNENLNDVYVLEVKPLQVKIVQLAAEMTDMSDTYVWHTGQADVGPDPYPGDNGPRPALNPANGQEKHELFRAWLLEVPQTARLMREFGCSEQEAFDTFARSCWDEMLHDLPLTYDHYDLSMWDDIAEDDEREW